MCEYEEEKARNEKTKRLPGSRSWHRMLTTVFYLFFVVVLCCYSFILVFFITFYFRIFHFYVFRLHQGKRNNLRVEKQKKKIEFRPSNSKRKIDLNMKFEQHTEPVIVKMNETNRFIQKYTHITESRKKK